MRSPPLLLCLALAACQQSMPTPPPDLPPPCAEEAVVEACGAQTCGTAIDRCGRIVGCGPACAVPDAGCLPMMMTACAGRSCGEVDAGCGEVATCGSCSGAQTCTSDGRCEDVVVDAGMDAGQPPADGGTCFETRSLIDRPDDSALPQYRALYVIPSDVDDDAHDTNGRICTSVRAFNRWLDGQVGARLRYDTFGGALDVGFVRLARTDAEMRGTTNAANVDTGIAYVVTRIERELKAMGVVKPGKLYTVWYGGTSEYACGGAPYPPTLPGQVVAMYLKAQLTGHPPCQAAPWGSSENQLFYFDWAMLHDSMHALGIVPAQAPHHHAFGHVYDTQSSEPQRDLMYQPRTSMDAPWASNDARGLVLDIDADDYAGHDAGFVDVKRSAFLDPMPAGATLPPGWP